MLSFVLVAMAASVCGLQQDTGDVHGAHPDGQVVHSPRKLTTAYPPDPAIRSSKPLFLPLEIGTDDIERYARILELSPEQRRYFDALFERYEAENLALMEERLRSLWAEAAHVARPGAAAPFDLDRALENSEFYRKREDYARRMVAVERNFFDSLALVLDVSQLINMERVRLLRERDHYPIPTTELHGATLDLTVMIDELEHRFDSFLVADRPALLAELEAYDRRLTSLRRDLWQAWLQRMTRGVELLAERRLAQDVSAKQALTSKRQLIVRRGGRLVIQLADMNDRSLERLSQFFEPRGAHLLRRSYLVGAYPRVHPNHHDVREVIEDILRDGGLSNEVASVIEVLTDSYTLKEERLNAELRQLCRDFGERYEMSPQRGAMEAAFLDSVESGRAERVRLAERLLNDIQSLLPEGEYEQARSAIAAYRARIQRLPDSINDPTVRADRSEAQTRESETVRALRGVNEDR